MRHSENCSSMSRSFEGLKLKAYQDQVSVWTNGYGNTHGVTSATQPITLAQAEADLQRNLAECGDAVNRLTQGIKLTQNQFDALVDFVLNFGPGRLATSSLLRLLRAGDKLAAANEFPKWNHAGGVVVAGLTRRREAEKELFLRP